MANAVVGDFIHIVGDTNVKIGKGSNSNGFKKKFNTGGRHAPGLAYITFMIRGMTDTKESAEVSVNSKVVGKLFHNWKGRKQEWTTQSVTLKGTDLNNGSNTIHLSTVDKWGSSNPGKDDYFVRNVICHFHQRA